MCVIIIKPAGVKMPSNDILEAAYIANPDGCGFVSTNHYYKSLSYARFKAELAKVDDSEACIIHFRLATNGSVKRANCHPFKNHDVFFAHNGVLSIPADGDKTDSQTAFDRLIYPAIERHGYESPIVDKVVDTIIGGSRFAMMRAGSYDVEMYGSYMLCEDGCYYSNLRFMTWARWAFSADRCKKLQRRVLCYT